MPYFHIIMFFVIGAEKSFLVQAERQQYKTLRSLTLDTPALVLKDLITDLLDTDHACNNNKTVKPSGSALIKGKGSKGKKKCKHCHQEDPRHSEKDCLAVNTEKRKEQEDKTGKKQILYNQYIKKKSKAKGKDKKPRKSRKPEDFNNNNKPIHSLIAQLRSVFKTTLRAFISLYQDKQLADSRANRYITNNKAQFNIYQLAKFNLIKTIGGYIIP